MSYWFVYYKMTLYDYVGQSSILDGFSYFELEENFFHIGKVASKIDEIARKNGLSYTKRSILIMNRLEASEEEYRTFKEQTAAKSQ